MKISIIALILSVGLFSFSTAMAEKIEITGKQCKEHISPANFSSTNLFKGTLYEKEPDKVHLEKLAQLKESDFTNGMPAATKTYITGLKQVLNECKNHCEGLKLNNNTIFKCEALKEATANNILHLSKDNRYISDTQNVFIEAAFADLDAPPAPTPNPHPPLHEKEPIKILEGVSEENQAKGYQLRDSLFESREEETPEDYTIEVEF